VEFLPDGGHAGACESNPTWVAYNERLFEGLRKAGMPEE
jgi:hypothetical protein